MHDIRLLVLTEKEYKSHEHSKKIWNCEYAVILKKDGTQQVVKDRI